MSDDNRPTGCPCATGCTCADCAAPESAPAACGCQPEQPVPPAASPPRWASIVPGPRAPRPRWHLIVGAVTLAVLTALVTVLFDRSGDGGTMALSSSAPGVVEDAAGGAQAVPADPQNADDLPPGVVDLRQGSVFLQSNDPGVNEVVAFSRDAEGALREVGRYPTGGSGTGSFEDSAQGIVLGTEQGEASPTAAIDDAQMLFVVNAGTSSVTVFRVYADRLERLSVTPTGGSRPVSVTVSNGILYVLNSGENDRRLLLGDGGALENCTHGTKPTITGFRVSGAGALTPIADSTRELSGQAESGCAQVSFAPGGETLVVSERLAEVEDGKTGALVTFAVNEDGTLGEKTVASPTGAGPFGFTFTRDGVLLSTEQNGGYVNPGGGGAAAYHVEDGQLTPVGETVANYQTDTCWIVVTRDERFAFASSPFEGGAISAYSVAADGQLTLAHPSATSPDGIDVIDKVVADGVTDLVLSQDGRYLYQLNSFEGKLYSFRVESDGRLTHLGTEGVFDLPPFGAGGQAAPFGIAAR